MSITTTIQKRWDDLSISAQAHIARTRPALLRKWDIAENGCYYDTIEADSVEEALHWALAKVDRANYAVLPQEDSEGHIHLTRAAETIWVEVLATNAVTGESDSDTVQLDPEVPACVSDEHDWRRPKSVVGEGVQGHGKGVIITEVCSYCGVYCVTDTSSVVCCGDFRVEYRAADDDSRRWISSRKPHAQ